MTAALDHTLPSRMDDRLTELLHLERLLEATEDFIDQSIVIPAEAGDNSRANAARARDHATAQVVACRLSLTFVRGELEAIHRQLAAALPRKAAS